jgi:uncharacterized protein
MKFFKVIFPILMVSYFPIQSFAINPDREYIRTPEDLGLHYASHKVKTGDGIEILTWTYSANPEKENGKLLILAYPDAGNMSYFVYQSAILANHGFTVVTFDYRGFGKSSDFPIERDRLYYAEFATDLISVAEFIHQKFPDKQIGIWALSMGSIIAVKALESLKDKINFLVTEGFVTDTTQLVDRIQIQKQNIIILPEKHEVFMNALNSLSLPILIFVASEDQITPYDDALSFKENTIEKCEIVFFEGERLSGFNSGEGEWGEFYIHKINEFLEIL